MSIEEELQRMSDPGEFERLATSVLRRADPLYESVIHTGINAEGKPIRDPVDGFGPVKDTNSPHYVYIEHTTTKKESLKGKWLSEPDPDSEAEPGDVIKAKREADKIRSEIPDARFTVALTSDENIGSDLAREAVVEGEKHGLSVEIWGFNEICEFLKNDPEGQWIAKQHFGIVERRLSEPLLLELSKKSMDFYQENFRIQATGPLVKRQELSEVVDVMRGSESTKYFVPIVGNSGFGKTIMCYQAMDMWRGEEKPALRLNADDIQDATSLTQALQSALNNHQSDIDSSAGRDAIRIARSDGPLLVVIDDLNRADNPSLLFKRVSNWIGGVQNDEKNDSTALPVVILCPLWPRIWARQEHDMDYSKFADPIELEEFPVDTAMDLIQSQAEDQEVEISQPRAQDLARKVGRDPHLIGLLGQLIGRDSSVESLPETSKDVIEEYIDHSYKTAVENSSEMMISADYNLAVEQLSLNMLRETDFEPAWGTVRSWSFPTSDDLQALRSLTKQAQLLIRFERQKEEIISFRHDRIRDYLLANYSLKAIESSTGALEFIDDPYYYSIFGKGVAYFRPPESVLSRLCKENPLCLLEALRELGRESSEYKDRIKAIFQDWLDEQGGPEQLPPSVRGEAINVLYETKGQQVIDIAESFPNWPQVLLARFRNGDIGAGIHFCGMYSSPGTNDPRRDSVMKQVRSQKKEAYAKGLSEVFSSLEKEHISGALRLAGFLESPILASEIAAAWEEFGEDDSLLRDFIWAGFQCEIPSHQSVVDEALDRWSSLPRGNGESVSKFGQIYTELKFSLTRNISGDQVGYLIDAVDKFPDVEYQLLLFLNKIPNPDALECVAIKAGERASESDSETRWVNLSQFIGEWAPDHPRGQALPPKAKDRMKSLWSDEEKSDEVRYSAFRFWVPSAEKNDLEALQEMSRKETFEYHANMKRLQLGDKSILQSSNFDPLENTRYLKAFVEVWCQEAHGIIDEILDQEVPEQRADLHHDLGELLIQLDRDSAEELLIDHWESIGHHRAFFQAALYTATPLTRELAEQTYSECDNPGHLFDHIGMLFGFNAYGKSELLSREHLLALEPYLTEIDDLTLSHIAERAKEFGMASWSAKNVQPLMSENARHRAHPTDEDLFKQLDEIEDEDNRRSIASWIDMFNRRSEPLSRAFEILEEWLKKDPTIDRYTIVAAAIRNSGTREDISILDRVLVESENAQYVYNDAEFGAQVRSLN